MMFRKITLSICMSACMCWAELLTILTWCVLVVPALGEELYLSVETLVLHQCQHFNNDELSKSNYYQTLALQFIAICDAVTKIKITCICDFHSSVQNIYRTFRNVYVVNKITYNKW